jgi:hypothetical protein
MSIIFGDQSDPFIPETLSGKQRAKNQTLTGIDNEANTLVGDVDTITDKAKGGNDHLTGGNNSILPFLLNTLVGDANFMLGSAQGGNDTLIGGDYSGSSDIIDIGTSSRVRNSLTGDALGEMSGSTHGGNDTLIGGNNTGAGSSFSPVFALVTNGLAGDSRTDMSGSAQGGNDTLIGGSNSGSGDGFLVANFLQGDANQMFDDTHGGNDTLIGGNNSVGNGLVTNGLVGDAGAMSDSAHGGNDHLIGGSNTGPGSIMNTLFGEGGMSGSTQGGNDTLTGGNNSGSGTVTNTLRGDASTMSGSAQGGNDILKGGDNSGSGSVSNELVGDAEFMLNSAQGGNDRLISGTNARDQMWGDAKIINGVIASPTAPTGTVTTGSDTYVFAPGNGRDSIMDFRQSDHDKIDVSAFGFADFAALSLAISDNGVNTLINFGGGNGVVLVGFADSSLLTAGDFILV